MNTETVQARADRLVNREVHLCVSSIVSTLAAGCDFTDRTNDAGRELQRLAEQAFELASPVPDYEEAAVREGWARNTHNGLFVAPIGSETRMVDYENWQELCEDNDIEPYEREVFEHWAVSDWLADKLLACGEKVDKDFGGLNVGARTTTGQAISIDGVIETIARELLA